GSERLAAQPQELDLLVERQVIQLLLRYDDVERLRGRMQELEGALCAAVEPAFCAVRNLLRVGIDADDLGVAFLAQRVDEVARAAADDEDLRGPIRRHVRQ